MPTTSYPEVDVVDLLAVRPMSAAYQNCPRLKRRTMENKPLATAKQAILRIAPIDLERELWAKSKHNSETYSKLVHQKLNDCIKDFEKKKTDINFEKTVLNPIRDIVVDSVTELPKLLPG